MGCALTAHEIVAARLLPLNVELQFHDCWTTCPLHDVGKLVIGVYFWDSFALIMGDAVTSGRSFRETERRLGDVAAHDEIGRLGLASSISFPDRKLLYLITLSQREPSPQPRPRSLHHARAPKHSLPAF